MSDRAFESEHAVQQQAEEVSPAPSIQMLARQADARQQQSAHIVQRLRGASETAVQRRGGGAADAVHAAAARGVQGSGGSLPHLGAIQRSFGRHDVSGVPAHVGGQAAEASQAMGAEAYASGGAVAFKRSPDLHTAAHEAAHVVQQRGGVQLKGGVGEVGDRYEQHADAVADRVVQGRSAEDLLDAGPGGGGGSGVQRAVQREESPEGEEKSEPWWRLTPEVSLKSPLITGFNQGPEAKLSIDPAGGITGSGSVSGSIDKPFGGSFEHPIGPALVKALASGEFAVKAKGGFSVKGAIKKHEDDPDKDYADLTIGPNGAIEFVASGKLAAGPAIGVKDVANLSVMGFGQLEAKFETAIAIDGGLRWGKDGLKGVLKMPVDMKGTITVSGGFLVVAEFVKEDVELAELKLAEADIARTGVKVTPTVTMPGGAVAGGKPEFTKPEWILGVTAKVQKLQNAMGPAAAKIRMELERKKAEMRRRAAANEAAYQQAQNERASQMGVDDPSQVTPDQQYTPMDQPQASGAGPNASYDPGPAADDGPNYSGGGPNASYDPGMSTDPSQS